MVHAVPVVVVWSVPFPELVDIGMVVNSGVAVLFPLGVVVGVSVESVTLVGGLELVLSTVVNGEDIDMVDVPEDREVVAREEDCVAGMVILSEIVLVN